MFRYLFQPGGETNTLGWVGRLPSKKRLGYFVQYTNGVTEVMSEEEGIGRLGIASSTVCDF